MKARGIIESLIGVAILPSQKLARLIGENVEGDTSS
jgi:hypothetical protein